MDNERRDYLLSFDEIGAASLPREDWYDRTRLLRRKEANDMLERISRKFSFKNTDMDAKKKKSYGGTFNYND
jgi:hypothetical protein